MQKSLLNVSVTFQSMRFSNGFKKGRSNSETFFSPLDFFLSKFQSERHATKSHLFWKPVLLKKKKKHFKAEKPSGEREST